MGGGGVSARSVGGASGWCHLPHWIDSEQLKDGKTTKLKKNARSTTRGSESLQSINRTGSCGRKAGGRATEGGSVSLGRDGQDGAAGDGDADNARRGPVRARPGHRVRQLRRRAPHARPRVWRARRRQVHPPRREGTSFLPFSFLASSICV
jgi:hypothetical protein